MVKLGKTKDSRTRGMIKPLENEDVLKGFKEKLLKKRLYLGANLPEFTDYLARKGHSITSISRYVQDVIMFLRWAEQQLLPIDFIIYSDVLHYIQGIKKTLNQRSVSTRLNSLKHYFNYLEASGQRSENPTTLIKIRGVKRKILYDILTHQELERLYNNFELPEEENKTRNQNWFKSSVAASKRNKVILGLMIYQGMNSYELGGLLEKDMKLREGKVYIAGGRRSNERELKLEAHQVLDIIEYQLKIRLEILHLTGKNSDKFFVSTGNSEQFRSIITKLLQKLRKQNSRVKSANQIRASVITHWLKLYNLRRVQYMAGHRFVSSTEGYLINDLDDLGEELQRYHPI